MVTVSGVIYAEWLCGVASLHETIVQALLLDTLTTMILSSAVQVALLILLPAALAVREQEEEARDPLLQKVSSETFCMSHLNFKH